MITIAFASDHAGYALKQALLETLASMPGYEALNLGTDSEQSVDYPDFGTAAAKAVLEKKAKYAVIICGSGIGISIAANRHKGIRAALCCHTTAARLSRQHNDANVLALGARMIGVETARDCLKIFLETPFEGGRHQGRVQKLG